MPPRVRQFVVETALDVIADAFEVEAVVVARRDEGSAPAAVATRFPASWDDGSASRFELFGQLWNLLDEEPPTSASDGGRPESVAASDPATECSRSVWSRTVPLGSQSLWLACHQSGERRLAAAAVSSRPLDRGEQVSLRRLIQSISGAVDSTPDSGVAVASVSLVVDGDSTRAEVAVQANDGGLVAFGEAETAERAVAEAAVNLLGRQADVTFAGRIDLHSVVVSIVVLVDETGTPLIGLSTSESQPLSGVVEAVFGAVGE